MNDMKRLMELKEICEYRMEMFWQKDREHALTFGRIADYLGKEIARHSMKEIRECMTTEN